MRLVNGDVFHVCESGPAEEALELWTVALADLRALLFHTSWWFLKPKKQQPWMPLWITGRGRRNMDSPVWLIFSHEIKIQRHDLSSLKTLFICFIHVLKSVLSKNSRGRELIEWPISLLDGFLAARPSSSAIL